LKIVRKGTMKINRLLITGSLLSVYAVTGKAFTQRNTSINQINKK